MAFGAGTRPIAVRVVLVAGLAAVLLAIAIGGEHATRGVLDSNNVGSEQFVGFLGPRKVLCQTGENVPAGAGLVRMTIGTYGKPGPPLRISVQDGERKLLPAGSLAAGWMEGVVDVPLGGEPQQSLSDVRVCIANRGDVRVVVAGANIGSPARVGRHKERGRVRVEYIRGKPRSAWSLASQTASRMTFGRGLWDGLAPWTALVLVLLGASAAGRALLRSLRDEEPA